LRVFPSDETIPFGSVRVCGTCKPIFMQKLAEGAKIGGELQYARVVTRFAAMFVDSLVLQAVNFAIIFMLGIFGISLAERSSGAESVARILGMQFLIIGFSVLFAASYEIFMIGKFGAT